MGDCHLLETLLLDPTYIPVALGQEPPHQNRVRPRRPNLQLLLSSAAQSGHLVCVQALLKFGYGHKIAYDAFVTRWEVFAALKSGEDAILKEFIKTWPDVVNLEMGLAGHPLLQTLLKDNFDLSAHLLDHGADSNAICGPHRRPGRYIRLAAKQLGLQYTTFLLEHGAQVSQTGAIRMAAEKGRLDVLRLLIEHGGDVNERLMPDAGFFTQKTRFQRASETPLYVATWNGHRAVVMWLLEQGADTEIGDLNGKTPFMVATEKEDHDLQQMLRPKEETGV